MASVFLTSAQAGVLDVLFGGIAEPSGCRPLLIPGDPTVPRSRVTN
jgi:hypothetical protein